CDRRWMPNHDRFECQTAIDSDAILHRCSSLHGTASFFSIFYIQTELEFTVVVKTIFKIIKSLIQQ
ncbi:hypothetical protein, partial [Escherichia coli]|uniref:hypothetical protein n=1 Tax=Escherichia coli TaxID=562 RepID=UPI00374CE359